MSKERVYFDRAVEIAKFYLTLIGLNFDNDINYQSRWFYFYNFIHLNIEVACEITWLFKHMSTGIDIIEVTYIIPCLSLCFLGNAKTLLFLFNMDNVRELTLTLNELFKAQRGNTRGNIEENLLLWKEFRNMRIIGKLLLFINASGATGFAVGPLVILASKYCTTGDIKLLLPFIVSYPFDYTDLRFYPLAYLHQLWTAWVAVFSVYSPDSFYYVCCASITVQFRTLRLDIEKIMVRKSTRASQCDKTLRAEFLKIIRHHRQLIRCVDLLEKICSKSNLMNVITSSFLICATGFNILAIDNLPLMIPFISFLNLSIIQIFILCYNGDQIMRSVRNFPFLYVCSFISMELSNAIYRCKWYNCNVVTQKDILVVLMRTQKPCILTAYGFTVINIRAFTKILSTAWSYFALLTTLYRN